MDGLWSHQFICRLVPVEWGIAITRHYHCFHCTAASPANVSIGLAAIQNQSSDDTWGDRGEQCETLGQCASSNRRDMPRNSVTRTQRVNHATLSHESSRYQFPNRRAQKNLTWVIQWESARGHLRLSANKSFITVLASSFHPFVSPRTIVRSYARWIASWQCNWSTKPITYLEIRLQGNAHGKKYWWNKRDWKGMARLTFNLVNIKVKVVVRWLVGYLKWEQNNTALPFRDYPQANPNTHTYTKNNILPPT